MKNSTTIPSDFSDLRLKAELRFYDNTACPDLRSIISADKLQLIHELQLHMIMLEIQKEELRSSLESELASKERFSDFFDSAPVGFVSLKPNGTIILTNRTAALLLDSERDRLTGGRFKSFVAAGDQAVFTDFVYTVFTTGVRQSCEVQLVRKGRPLVYAQIEGGLSRDRKECRCVIVDSTNRKKNEAIQQARSRLMEYALTHTIEELLVATLDEAEILTGSRVGFYHFVEADQQTLSLQAWSTRTTREMCKAEGKGQHYDVANAGVWVDCVRKRRPVIHNNYAALPHRKGLPEGHAPIIRELVVPIFRDKRIVALLGVGNKTSNYDAADVEAVFYLADIAWDISIHKHIG